MHKTMKPKIAEFSVYECNLSPEQLRFPLVATFPTILHIEALENGFFCCNLLSIGGWLTPEIVRSLMNWNNLLTVATDSGKLKLLKINLGFLKVKVSGESVFFLKSHQLVDVPGWCPSLREWCLWLREWCVQLREWCLQLREWCLQLRGWCLWPREWCLQLREWCL